MLIDESALAPSPASVPPTPPVSLIVPDAQTSLAGTQHGRDQRDQDARKARESARTPTDAPSKSPLSPFSRPPAQQIAVAASKSPLVSAPSAASVPPPQPAAKPTQEGEHSEQAGNGADGEAERSDKQSPASSTRTPVVVRPGRVIAAEGLEIVTRRVEFTTLTKATAWPLNPVVRVTFGRRGHVRSVKILSSSGDDGVDIPVVTAVYSWQARGKAIDDLPPDPEAGISETFKIILR